MKNQKFSLLSWIITCANVKKEKCAVNRESWETYGDLHRCKGRPVLGDLDRGKGENEMFHTEQHGRD